MLEEDLKEEEGEENKNTNFFEISDFFQKKIKKIIQHYV